MTEKQILNEMTPNELVTYMELIEECTIIVERMYAEERAQFNNKTKSLYDY